MASRKEYAYYLSGNRIAIVEKDHTGIDDGLNYTYVDGAGLDAPSGSTTLKSPVATVTNGLEIEYAYNPITITDESDIIDLPDYLARALVHYVKAKLAEDALEMDKKDYFMREFYVILDKYESSKIWGARMISPGPNAIR